MSPLAPGFLVAAPPLGDPNFDRSVVLLASHGDDGAFGWVINGPWVMSLEDLITHAGVVRPTGDRKPTGNPAPPFEQRVTKRSESKSAIGKQDRDQAKGNRRRGAVHFGGPVGRQQVWLLYRTDEGTFDGEDQVDVGFGISASASQKALEEVARGKSPPSLRGVLGYAGWEASQLELEIARGAWLPTNADASLVFDVPLDQVWTLAYQRAGTLPIAFTSRFVGQA